jgi:LacI family transcriptional regulator
MSTIREVAKRAGVSPITVSRVINDYDYVSSGTRQRVEAVIEELGYVPNMLGPSLRSKQTMTLALVMTDITNPFWTTVARGVEDVAQANGYSTILCNTDESEDKQEHYLQMLLRRRIDGILLVPACSDDPKPVQIIQKQGIPVVLLDRQIPDVQVDIVRADSESGAYQLTQHLLSRGYRQIALLTGRQTVSTAVDRANGYLRALADAGLPDSAAKLYWGEFTQDSGFDMANQALSAAPQPTALFAANNFIALGALQALHEQGLHVPDDIALVTLDDSPPNFPIALQKDLDPFLTVVNQPAREMGQQAAQLLLDRLKDAIDAEYRHIVLPTKMIIRASRGQGPFSGQGITQHIIS